MESTVEDGNNGFLYLFINNPLKSDGYDKIIMWF